MSIFGPPNIEKMKANKDINGLIQSLSYTKDEKICISAVKALGTIENPRAVSALIMLLPNKNKELGDAAFDSLAKIGGAEAVAALAVPLLRVNLDAEECAKYADVLARIGDIHAFNTLSNILKKDYGFYVHKAVINAISQFDSPQAVESLIPLLEDSSNSQAAADSLVKIGGQRVKEALVKALEYFWEKTFRDDRIYQDQTRSITRALDKCGWKPDNTLAGLYYWIEKRDWNKSADFGLSSFLPLCMVLTNASNLFLMEQIDEIKNAIIRACKQNGDCGDELKSKAINIFIQKLKFNYWDETICKISADILGEVGQKQAFEPLLALFTKENRDRLKSKMLPFVAMALIKVDKNVVKRLLLNIENHKMEQESIIALGELKDHGVIEFLIKFLKAADNFETKEDIIIALGNIGEPRSIEVLSTYLDDKVVGHFAAQALGDIGQKEAVGSLFIALQNIYTCDAAAVSLMRIGEPIDESLIIKVLFQLCHAYEFNDQTAVNKLEPLATRIGEELNIRGGMVEMKRVFSELKGISGTRTLEMHWGGIGEWRG